MTRSLPCLERPKPVLCATRSHPTGFALQGLGSIGILGVYMGYIGWGLYKDHGKENGDYYSILGVRGLGV